MNPLPTNGEMTLKDAAIVALFLMLGTIAIVYLPTHSYDVIVSEPYQALFDLFVLGFASWIGDFLVLTGLNVFAKRAQETTNTTTT